MTGRAAIVSSPGCGRRRLSSTERYREDRRRLRRRSTLALASLPVGMASLRRWPSTTSGAALSGVSQTGPEYRRKPWVLITVTQIAGARTLGSAGPPSGKVAGDADADRRSDSDRFAQSATWARSEPPRGGLLWLWLASTSMRSPRTTNGRHTRTLRPAPLVPSRTLPIVRSRPDEQAKPDVGPGWRPIRDRSDGDAMPDDHLVPGVSRLRRRAGA